MKAPAILIGLNLVLTGVLVYALTHRSANTIIPSTVSAPIQSPPPAPAVAAESSSVEWEPKPFQWRQLECTNNYRIYIANLRASGCPESTVADIVRGDTARAFAWERRQLSLEESGDGPWSKTSEMQLVASLLGAPMLASGPDTVAPSAENASANSETSGTGVSASAGASTATAYPLFAQNVNWNALGFNSDQQAAIAQVRQQFLDAVNSPNSNAGDSSSQNDETSDQNTTPANDDPRTKFPTAKQNAEDQLRGLLGGQAYAAYEQQEYDEWFQPQASANLSGNLVINAGAFSVK